MRFRNTTRLLKETFSEITNRDFKRLAAALAHYMSFSVIPAVIVIASITALVLDHDDIQEHIVVPIAGVTNEETARVVEDAILATREGVGDNPVAAALGVITLLYGASRMFRHLKYSLNYLWEIPQPAHSDIGSYLRDSLISMFFVIVFGLLFVVILVAEAVLFAAVQVVDDILPGLQFIPVVQVGGVVGIFLLMTVLFAILFHFLPDARVAWRDLWVGSAMTSLLFLLAQVAVALYSDVVDIDSTYGAATAIIVVLIWVYLTSHLILFGARFTFLFANRHGDKIRPQPAPDAPDTAARGRLRARATD